MTQLQITREEQIALAIPESRLQQFPPLLPVAVAVGPTNQASSFVSTGQKRSADLLQRTPTRRGKENEQGPASPSRRAAKTRRFG